MDKLPETPDHAAAIQPSTMTIEAAKAAIRECLAVNARDKGRGIARLIANHGRKYTAEARAWAGEYAAGRASI